MITCQSVKCGDLIGDMKFGMASTSVCLREEVTQRHSTAFC